MEIDALDEAIKNIDKKLDEKLKVSDDKFNQLANNIVTEIRSAKEPPPTKKWIDSDEDDDAYVTKADMRKIITETMGELNGKTKQVAEEVYNEKSNKMSKDMQVFLDFKEADKKSSKYDPKFLEEVQVEMNNRVGRGRSAEDPDLMYDAAQSIWNKWVRSGRTSPEHLVKRTNEKMNADEDSFDVNGGYTNRSFEPNERQLQMASKFGLSKERLKQHLERFKKNAK